MNSCLQFGRIIFSSYVAVFFFIGREEKEKKTDHHKNLTGFLYSVPAMYEHPLVRLIV